MAFADESLLPDRFPQDLNSPEKIEVLKKWVNLTTDHSYTNFHVDEIQLKDQTWMNVYYELQFSIFHQRDLNKLEEQIESMLKIYNSAGFKIGVVFTPYIEILDVWGDSLRIFGKKKDVSVDLMRLDVSDPEDPVWRRYGMNGANSYFNTSFVILEENVGYINLRNENPLPHELNHLLFQHKDAYKKTAQLSEEEASLVCNLNAKHCSGAIHPLEIYVGLKRYGHSAPQWNYYVDRTYIFQDLSLQKLKINSEKNLINNNGDLFLKFYSMNGSLTHQIRYCTENCNPQDVLVPHIPNVIDLDFLEPGAYMVDATIVQHGNDQIFGNPIFTNSIYQHTARIFVEPN